MKLCGFSLSYWTLTVTTTTTITVLVTGQNTNNAGTVANDPNLRTFNEELAKVGLSAGNGKTIFAPNNDAFTNYSVDDPIMYPKYFNDNEYFLHRRELLQWLMVTEDTFTTEAIFDNERRVMENANGNITIVQDSVNPLQATLDGVRRSSIVTADIATNDGIVHVLDRFIVAPYLGLNIIGQCLDDQSAKFAFTTMAQLAIHGELRDEIDKVYDHGITFLVPPNRRFNRAEIHVPTLMTEEMKEYTRDFVRCHMIMNHNYYESAVFSLHEEQELDETLEVSYLGTNIWITTTDDRLRFQSRDLLLPDQVARNGVFHGMEFPLFPPFGSDFTDFTWMSTQYDTSDTFRMFVQCLLTSEDIATMFNTTLTIFSPTREAFAGFNNEDFQRLNEPIWIRHSTEFLLNHIAAPAMTREELVAQAPGTITMLNGITYDLRKGGTTPKVRNGPQEVGRVFFGDLIALDGYVHIMDTVITPTHVSRSIYDMCRMDDDFSLLVENIDFVRLTDLVDRDLPLTMLVMPNKAFERITFSTLDGPDLLRQHIFRGLWFTDIIANQTRITSVPPTEVVHTVETKGPNGEYLYIGGAYVYEGDILTRNGVMHKIDRVIGYEYPTVAPTSSPAPTMTAEPTRYVKPTHAPFQTPLGGVPFEFPPADVPSKKPSRRPGGGASGATRSTSAFSLVSLLSSLILGLVVLCVNF